MNIIYNKNPLCTIVELDDNEKKELWYKIKIEMMEEWLSSTYFSLEEGPYFNLERDRQYSNTENYISYDDNVKSKLDTFCDTLLETYVNELKSCHSGDCTCFACSCMKCHAESLLGINTIPGLDKHAAHYINYAFGDGKNTIEQALECLYHYNPVRVGPCEIIKQEEFDKLAPRWKQQAQNAYEWLLNYKNNIKGN